MIAASMRTRSELPRWTLSRIRSNAESKLCWITAAFDTVLALYSMYSNETAPKWRDVNRCKIAPDVAGRWVSASHTNIPQSAALILLNMLPDCLSYAYETADL